MKTFAQYINEKLKINKNFDIDYNTLVQYIADTLMITDNFKRQLMSQKDYDEFLNAVEKYIKDYNLTEYTEDNLVFYANSTVETITIYATKSSYTKTTNDKDKLPHNLQKQYKSNGFWRKIKSSSLYEKIWEVPSTKFVAFGCISDSRIPSISVQVKSEDGKNINLQVVFTHQ